MWLQLAFILYSVTCLALPESRTSSRTFQRSVQYSPDAGRANAVKEAFLFAWNGYHTYAFPNDELHPVSNGYGNSRFVIKLCYYLHIFQS